MQDRRPRSATALAVGATAAALAVSACTGTATDEASDAGPAGQLTVLSLGPVATWDPQRISTAQDIAFAGRVFARTLTAFPAGADGLVELDLADADGFGGDLDALVLAAELQRLLERQLLRRDDLLEVV